MRRKRKSLGESMADQFDARRGLKNKRVGHQEVYSGELADEALGALGARAMTVDNEIIVNNTFNANQAEDQALLHTKCYQEFFGWCCRFIDEMQKKLLGLWSPWFFTEPKTVDSNLIPKKASELLRDEKESGGGGAKSAATNEAETKNEQPKAEKGYQVLKERGFTHEMIVQHLMFRVMDEMERKSARTMIVPDMSKFLE